MGGVLSDGVIFKKYGIVDDFGRFTREIIKILQNSVIPNELLEAIYIEWDMQISKVIYDEAVECTHIDGHHHIHHYYALSGVLEQLLEKYNLPVRRRYHYPTKCVKTLISGFIEFCACEKLLFIVKAAQGRQPTSFLNFFECHLENALWNRRFKDFIKSDYFDSYEHFVSVLNRRIKNDCVVELMCHPGSKQYSHEYDLIKTSPMLIASATR